MDPNLDLTSLRRAVAALADALQEYDQATPAMRPTLRASLRGGAIQAFKVCGLVDDAAVWFKFGLARNASTHTYRVETADEVAASAEAFLPEAQKLLAALHNAQV